MSNALDKKELLEILDRWIKEERNIKGGMVRALFFKGKREKVKEITDEEILRERAYNQIVALIGASKEVTEEWYEEKAGELSKHIIELIHLWADGGTLKEAKEKIKDFIRKLYEEIRGK